jgi:two-component system, OmpR family, KDP operon response regulator KdpE
MPKSADPVLVIDRDPRIRRLLAAALELHGYVVNTVDSGSAGLEAAVHARPDLIILDPALPDMHGVDLLGSIRAWSNVPIIVVSVDADEEQKVALLELGADDFVVKPFGIAEMAARCAVALRRHHKGTERNSVVRTGPLVIDFVSRAVTMGDERIALTRKEYRLLQVLASHLGRVVTHQQLIGEIWERRPGDSVQCLRMLVRKLRRKIEPDPDRPIFVETESGIGYRLQHHNQRTAG